MPQPPSLQATADPLIESYRSAWERVLKEQERLLADPRQWRRSRRLEETSRTIKSVMDGLDSEMSDWVAQQYPKIYGAGLADGAAAAGTSPVWSTIHQEAVQRLASGIYEDLLSATTHVNETTKDLIRMLSRQAGTGALITGETAQGAARVLAKELAANSIAAVIYKDGSRHGLAEYAEMNLRTTTALGYNNGTLNAAPDTVFWECFDGPGCGWSFHEDTEQALGKIVTRDEALGFPISHPNCRRSFGPRPDLNKTASAAERKGSVEPTQVEAQRAQDAERLAQQNRRAGRSPRREAVSENQRDARGGWSGPGASTFNRRQYRSLDEIQQGDLVQVGDGQVQYHVSQKFDNGEVRVVKDSRTSGSNTTTVNWERLHHSKTQLFEGKGTLTREAQAVPSKPLRPARLPRAARKAPEAPKATWIPEEAAGAPRGMGSALPADQDQIWARYAGQSFETNSALRRGEFPPETGVLDQVFKTSRTPEATTTYRMIDDEKLYNRIARRKENGTVGFRDDAYLSTTLDKDVVADFSRDEFPVRLDIDIAQGTPAFYVGDRYASRAIMMDQKEMVFPRGANLRVYDHRRLSDGTIVARAFIDGFAPLL